MSSIPSENPTHFICVYKSSFRGWIRDHVGWVKHRVGVYQLSCFFFISYFGFFGIMHCSRVSWALSSVYFFLLIFSLLIFDLSPIISDAGAAFGRVFGHTQLPRLAYEYAVGRGERGVAGSGQGGVDLWSLTYGPWSLISGLWSMVFFSVGCVMFPVKMSTRYGWWSGVAPMLQEYECAQFCDQTSPSALK